MLFQHLLHIVHICTVVQKKGTIAMSTPKKHKHLVLFTIIALTKKTKDSVVSKMLRQKKDCNSVRTILQLHRRYNCVSFVFPFEQI